MDMIVGTKLVNAFSSLCRAQNLNTAQRPQGIHSDSPLSEQRKVKSVVSSTLSSHLLNACKVLNNYHRLSYSVTVHLCYFPQPKIRASSKKGQAHPAISVLLAPFLRNMVPL